MNAEAEFIPVPREDLERSVKKQLEYKREMDSKGFTQGTPKKGDFDLTSGSVDRRARNELAEIEKINQNNSRPPPRRSFPVRLSDP